MRAEVEPEPGTRSRPHSRMAMTNGRTAGGTEPDDEQSEWAKQEQQVSCTSFLSQTNPEINLSHER